VARSSLVLINGKNRSDFNQFADLFIGMQGRTELLRGQQQSRAWPAKPVLVDGNHRYIQLRSSEHTDVFRLLRTATRHNGLRMAHQHLLTADLRPADAAVSKDVPATT